MAAAYLAIQALLVSMVRWRAAPSRDAAHRLRLRLPQAPGKNALYARAAMTPPMSGATTGTQA